jgi:multiple sugar transport system permease protein
MNRIRGNRKFLKRSLKIIILLVYILFFSFPIYWLILTSFKPTNEILTWPPIFIPSGLTLEHFSGGTSIYAIAGATDMGRPLINSLVTSLGSSFFASLILAPPAAYALTRFRVGGKFMALWFLTIRTIPLIGVAIPYYLIFKDLGLIDTWWAIILATIPMNTSFGIWLLIGFFNDVPREIDEAAKIDGMSTIRAFYTIIMPLVLPGLVVLSILNFIATWNNFMVALLFTTSPEAQTVPAFIGSLRTEEAPTLWGPMAAAGLVAIIPVIIFTAFVQKYLVRGLTLGAIKG